MLRFFFVVSGIVSGIVFVLFTGLKNKKRLNLTEKCSFLLHKISSTNQVHNLREIMLIWRLLMVMRYPQRTHPMEKTEMAITF